MTLARKQVVTAYLFLLIPVVFFVCVRFIPMLYALVMGMTDWGLLNKNLRFLGLENFKTLLGDEVFRTAFGNTLQYALFGVPVVILLSLFFALHLNAISKGQGGFRLIYILPYITPVVAVSWVWRWMFQAPPLGLVNGMLAGLGLQAQGFLNSPDQALPTITAVNVWVELGYCVTIFLAGIQNIPRDFLEAARMDGASNRQVLAGITLPLLLPITLFLTVIEGIQFLRIFTQVYNMSYQSLGGPLDSTKSVALFIYQKAFTNFQMGVAAAASLLLFLVIMVVTLIQMRFFDRKISY